MPAQRSNWLPCAPKAKAQKMDRKDAIPFASTESMLATLAGPGCLQHPPPPPLACSQEFPRGRFPRQAMNSGRPLDPSRPMQASRHTARALELAVRPPDSRTPSSGARQTAPKKTTFAISAETECATPHQIAAQLQQPALCCSAPRCRAAPPGRALPPHGLSDWCLLTNSRRSGARDSPNAPMPRRALPHWHHAASAESPSRKRIFGEAPPPPPTIARPSPAMPPRRTWKRHACPNGRRRKTSPEID
jgi:hypothetical protein